MLEQSDEGPAGVPVSERLCGSLKPAAIAFMASLPRRVRTCEPVYSLALALLKEGAVVLTARTVLGNGQVRYQVEAVEEFSRCVRCKGKGYHHGFGEDGRDPDWCLDCGGDGR